MFRRRWLLILVVALMPLSSCSTECDSCDSDDDCDSGQMCVTFRDAQGNPLSEKRCGSGEGTTQCRTLGNRQDPAAR
jgi:hypothetical protein